MAKRGRELAAAVTAVLAVALFVLVPAVATAAEAPEVPWTLSAAQAAVESDAISFVTGAPAVLDADRVRNALAGTTIRVVLLPFTPTDGGVRKKSADQHAELSSWADQAGYELIEVRGLDTAFDGYTITPSDTNELQPILAQFDVTHQVLFAISHLQDAAEPPDSVIPDQIPASATDVEAIGDALAADGIYNDPALDEPQERRDAWATAGAGLTVRAAFLPPADRGKPLLDLVTPLSERFPGDLVAVVRGRWVEVAAPDQELADAALLAMYGRFLDPVRRWEVAPATLVRLTAEQVGLLRTGVTIDEQAPAKPTDPVTSASAAIPWIIGGIVLVIALATTAYLMLQQLREAETAAGQRRAQAAVRRAMTGRLTLLADQLRALDPLVDAGNSGAAAKRFAEAAERYQAGRNALGESLSRPAGADWEGASAAMTVANEAIVAAEKHVRAVAKALGVPLVAGSSLAGTAPDGTVADLSRSGEVAGGGR